MPSLDAVMISQARWSTTSVDSLVRPVLAAARARRPEGPLLVVLPLGEAAPGDASEPKVLADLGAAAAASGVFLAGAAPMGSGGSMHTVSFVVGADGEVLLTAPKLSPDLVDGFTDSSAAGAAPHAFAFADTPLGRIGLLPGEDVLFPHYVRALTWAGAELVVNSCREWNDAGFDARRRARISRAWESLAYVVCASPSEHGALALPPASCMIDWAGAVHAAKGGESLITAPCDIERLRRRRQDIFINTPVNLRAALYGPALQRAADRTPGPQPATRNDWAAEGERRVAAQARANTPLARSEDSYDALLVQTITRLAQADSDPQAIIEDNLGRALAMAAGAAGSPATRLVCFGEFFMTGSGGGGPRTPATLERLAITFPGPELDRIGAFAVRHKVYVCGTAFERDSQMPGHVFLSAFIVDDSGDLIHRYRKLQCADVWGTLPDTTPGSVYSRYLDLFGEESLFPVARTPLGNLATMICFDQAHPEIPRMLAKQGAEILLHPSAEGYGDMALAVPWEASRQTRAFENTAYVLSAMPGGEFVPGAEGPTDIILRGHSKAVRFDGTVIAQAHTVGTAAVAAPIDLLALRAARADPTVNLVAWDDPAAYAHAYEAGVGLPNDLWGADPAAYPYAGMKPSRDVLQNYNSRGIFVRPKAGSDDLREEVAIPVL